MEMILEQVKAFADNAHGDQQRKYSTDRYIVHPVRVMETCKRYTSSLSLLAAALLHDVLEDTSVSRDELLGYLRTLMNEKDAVHTTDLVTELTDVYIKASYPGLNRRTRKTKEKERMKLISAEAQTIKYADIMDNCREIAGEDADFAPLYLRECKALLGTMTRGNKDLQEEALLVVEEQLRQITLTRL